MLALCCFAASPGRNMTNFRAPGNVITGCGLCPRPGNWKFPQNEETSAFVSADNLSHICDACLLSLSQRCMIKSRTDRYCIPLITATLTVAPATISSNGISMWISESPERDTACVVMLFLALASKTQALPACFEFFSCNVNNVRKIELLVHTLHPRVKPARTSCIKTYPFMSNQQSLVCNVPLKRLLDHAVRW